MTRRWFHAGLLFFSFAAALHGQDRITPLSRLENIPGFEATATTTRYDASNVEQFEAALAPSLKLYGFDSVTIQEWKAPEGTVKATLFQMLDSPAAYGVYTLKRSTLPGQPTPVLIGAASFRHGNQLYFWQANYVAQIDGPKDLQDRLAQLLSRNILGRSQKPPVSEYLPVQNLIAGSERYLLSTDAIDRSIPVDPNTLGFDSSAEAATAAYRIAGGKVNLLLVLYPTQHLARKHLDEMETFAQIPPALRKRAGPLVAAVYGVRDEKLAAPLLDAVSHEYKVTWNEPRPGLGVATMLITIFTFIGVALAVTAFAGVSFGGLRIFIKSRYPDRFFDRPEAMELIQLKLAQVVTERQISDNSGTGGTRGI
jgi:hypothetical protein